MWVLKFSKYLVTQFFPPWVSEGNDLPFFFLKKRIKLTFTKKYAKDLYTDVSKIIQFFYFRFALPKRKFGLIWIRMLFSEFEWCYFVAVCLIEIIITCSLLSVNNSPPVLFACINDTQQWSVIHSHLTAIQVCDAWIMDLMSSTEISAVNTLVS